jgi:hypothetical protein
LANIPFQVSYAGTILSNLSAAGMVLQVPIQLSPGFGQIAMIAVQIGAPLPAMLARRPMPVVSRQCRGCFHHEAAANYDREKQLLKFP